MAKPTAQRSDVIERLANVFRIHGYEGASLAHICAGTQLGKGSIYHFFPGGKEEMAQAVLADIDDWFRDHIVSPLEHDADPLHGINRMFDEVSRYFLSGRKVCLMAVFALGAERDRFHTELSHYFQAWETALRGALMRAGHHEQHARDYAEDTLIVIQGGLVLARAWKQPDAFVRAVHRMKNTLLAA